MLALITQLCVTLWDPMDGSLPGSSDHGILQVRILEWVAISFSKDTPITLFPIRKSQGFQEFVSETEIKDQY